ncbi:MAG: dockerin type I domain-containing protein [Planctomycetota bacterium]
MFGDQYATIDAGVLFLGYDQQHGRELWLNSSPTRGSDLVKDLTTGESGSDIRSLVAGESGKIAYFDVGRHQLWRTDGTEQGTTRIWGDTRYVFSELTVVGDELIFEFTSQHGPDGVAYYDPNADRFFELTPDLLLHEDESNTELRESSQGSPFFVKDGDVHFVTSTQRSSRDYLARYYRVRALEIELRSELEVENPASVQDVWQSGDRTVVAILNVSSQRTETLLTMDEAGDDSPIELPEARSLHSVNTALIEDELYVSLRTERFVDELWKLSLADLAWEQVAIPEDYRVLGDAPLFSIHGDLFAGLRSSEGVSVGRLRNGQWNLSSPGPFLEYNRHAVLVGDRILYESLPDEDGVYRVLTLDPETLERSVEVFRGPGDPQTGIFGDLIGYGITRPSDPAAERQYFQFPRSLDYPSPNRTLPGNGNAELVMTPHGDVLVSVESSTGLEVYRYEPRLGEFLRIASHQRWIDSSRINGLPQRASDGSFLFIDQHLDGDALYRSDGTELGNEAIFTNQDRFRSPGAYREPLDIVRLDLVDDREHVFVTIKRLDPSLPTGEAFDIFLVDFSGWTDPIHSSTPTSYVADVLGVVNNQLVYSVWSIDAETQSVYATGTTTWLASNTRRILDSVPAATIAKFLAPIQSNELLYFYVPEAAPQRDDRRFFGNPSSYRAPGTIWLTDGRAATRPLRGTEMPSRVRDFLAERGWAFAGHSFIGRFGENWLVQDLADADGFHRVHRLSAESESVPVDFPDLAPNTTPVPAGNSILYRKQSGESGVGRYDPYTETISTAPAYSRVSGIFPEPAYSHPFAAVARQGFPTLVTDGFFSMEVPEAWNGFGEYSTTFIDRFALIDQQSLENTHESWLTFNTPDSWYVTASADQLNVLSQFVIDANGTTNLSTSYSTPTSDVTLNLRSSDAEIFVDIGSLRESTIKRLGIVPNPESTIHLRNYGGEEIRYVDRDDHVLVMTAGIEISITKRQPLRIRDEMTSPQARHFFTDDEDNQIRLSGGEDNTQVVSFEGGETPWSVNIATRGDSTYLHLGTGADTISIDDVYPRARLTRGAEQLHIHDTLRGDGTLAVELSDAYQPVERSSNEIRYDRVEQSQLSVIVTRANYGLHNPVMPADVNLDGAVSPVDALLIINRLQQMSFEMMEDGVAELDRLYDATSDGQVTTRDALYVINRMSQSAGAEGEQVSDRLPSTRPISNSLSSPDNAMPKAIDTAMLSPETAPWNTETPFATPTTSEMPEPLKASSASSDIKQQRWQLDGVAPSLFHTEAEGLPSVDE